MYFKSGQTLSQMTYHTIAQGTSTAKFAKLDDLQVNLLKGWISKELLRIKSEAIDKLHSIMYIVSHKNPVQNILSTTELHQIMNHANAVGERFAVYHIERPFVAMIPPSFEGVVSIHRDTHKYISDNDIMDHAYGIYTYLAVAPSSGGVVDFQYFNEIDIAAGVKS